MSHDTLPHISIKCEICSTNGAVVIGVNKLQILQGGQFDIHIRRLVDKSTIQCNISIMTIDSIQELAMTVSIQLSILIA